jgi:hypothetical protein
MKAKEKNTPKTTKPELLEKKYVVLDGKKVSRTWAAVLSLQGTGEIVDRRAVLK